MHSKDIESAHQRRRRFCLTKIIAFVSFSFPALKYIWTKEVFRFDVHRQQPFDIRRSLNKPLFWGCVDIRPTRDFNVCRSLMRESNLLHWLLYISFICWLTLWHLPVEVTICFVLLTLQLFDNFVCLSLSLTVYARPAPEAHPLDIHSSLVHLYIWLAFYVATFFFLQNSQTHCFILIYLNHNEQYMDIRELIGITFVMIIGS